MQFRTISATAVAALLLSAGAALADHHIAATASAKSAAPAVIADSATILDNMGNVLAEGTNGWTCQEESEGLGAHCSEQPWLDLLGAFANQAPYKAEAFSVSYMLAGEGDALGVSNSDPFATEPTADNDWVKEGPHLMVLVPGEGAMEGISTDPADAVYVMWKGTDYEHLMIRIAEEE